MAFLSAIRSEDQDAFTESLNALDRTRTWQEAFRRLQADSACIANWNFFYEGWLTHGRQIRKGVADDALLAETLRALAPPFIGQGLKLYRGEGEPYVSAGVYGFCWTRALQIAVTFAERWRAEHGSSGIVIETYAPIEAIIANGYRINEREYTIDPALVREVKVIEVFR